MNIIDRLVNGVGSISLSGTTHTLTTTDGTVSDGQYKVLVLGGSPSGTNTITVSPNNGQHIYIVKNGTGQTATFTQGSGANVSVLANTTKIIYCDGAGSGAAVVDITDSLDLGSLILAGTTVTATGAELNFVDGVTSNIQTQLDTKAPSSSPTLTSPTLTSPLTVTGGTQSWTVTASGTNLTFAYNGTNVLRVDSSGNLTALGDVTTNGTIS
jgi:hypothetical protein